MGISKGMDVVCGTICCTYVCNYFGKDARCDWEIFMSTYTYSVVCLLPAGSPPGPDWLSQRLATMGPRGLKLGKTVTAHILIFRMFF